MGTAACCKVDRRDDRIRQLDTLHPLKQKPVELSHTPQLHSSLVQHERLQQKSKPKERDWPLPPPEPDERFDMKWSTDMERYSVKRAYTLKASLLNKKLKSTHVEINDFHQKETDCNQWRKHNSSVHESAHVQSSLYTQSHACLNISTTEEIDRLFVSLNEVHAEVDLNVEQQHKLISEVTKSIIDTITKDTRDIQQNLLVFGKARQMKQDELYREWLQMYIIELNNWKSGRLANLQNVMETHQKNIMARSQRFIMDVNTEANTLKDKVQKTAQQEASYKIRQLIERIEAVSVHHLGTETMTKINLIIHGNVGNKMPGQGCTFDFDPCDIHDERNGQGVSGKQSTKKDSQKPNKPIGRQQVKDKKRNVEHRHEKQAIAFGHRETAKTRQDMSYVEDYVSDDQDEQ